MARVLRAGARGGVGDAARATAATGAAGVPDSTCGGVRCGDGGAAGDVWLKASVDEEGESGEGEVVVGVFVCRNVSLSLSLYVQRKCDGSRV